MRRALVAAAFATAAAAPGSLEPTPALPALPHGAPTLIPTSSAILAWGGPTAYWRHFTVPRGGPLRPVAPGPPRPAIPQDQHARLGLDNPAWALVLMTMIMAYEEYGWF